MPGVQVLGLLEPPEDVQEVGGAHRRVRGAVEEAAAALEQVARDVHVVVREVVHAVLEALENAQRWHRAELAQLRHEAAVADLGKRGEQQGKVGKGGRRLRRAGEGGGATAARVGECGLYVNMQI